MACPPSMSKSSFKSSKPSVPVDSVSPDSRLPKGRRAGVEASSTSRLLFFFAMEVKLTSLSEPCVLGVTTIVMLFGDCKFSVDVFAETFSLRALLACMIDCLDTLLITGYLVCWICETEKVGI